MSPIARRRSSLQLSEEEKRVALVTGGTSGIGAATAQLLLKRGYKVAICGSRQDKIDHFVNQTGTSDRLLCMAIDFGAAGQENGRRAVERTIEHFGRLDVLVNNAGTFAKTSILEPTSYEQYRHVMQVNLDATVQATLAAAEQLKRHRGQIVFVSSTASVRAHENGYAYSASKAAMTAFAKCVAIDLAPHKVRVNVVSPGPVVTDIFRTVGITPEVARVAMADTTLEGRVGEPHEVAESIVYLLGARYVSGHELFIDGGYLLKPGALSANAQIRRAAAAAPDQPSSL